LKQDELVVASNQFIGPALELASAGVQVEQTHLPCGVRRLFGTGQEKEEEASPAIRWIFLFGGLLFL
jgi:hypothetical protein